MAENKKPSKKKSVPSDSPQKDSSAVAPDMRGGSNSGGTQVQNPDQNLISESGNQVKGNSPGGNLNDVLSQRINKPRSNPNPTQQKAK
ncbi:hypothetical protein SAMN00120144_1538 [Hymenobacter roseosalivarius DSM 11622]|uniref:Uncharacterized protein n=1 Tax=Hymenobacter roseosalivarius DSM 11622 TaxID=645990 RepID=A0A1W1V2R8_9BACT|nr:hypothetical protein [Hymenobacter roseosalivarius]SMB87321.1 hypothetical protein SAMN00120144_1538 [Hymenobacter roseosalivarius DSM 11622]